MRNPAPHATGWTARLLRLKEFLCLGKRCHIIAIGGLLCLLLWVVDTAVDTLGLPDGSFWLQLIAPDTHKLLDHSQAAVVLFILVAISDFMLRKRRDAESALQEALAETRSEKSRSEGILDALGEAISIQDTSFRIIYQNERHREMMGDHGGEQCYRAYNQRETICDDCVLARAFRDGRPHTKEKAGTTVAGPVTVEITASALRDGDGTIIAGIEAVRDISQRKQVEEEIIRLNNDLMRQAEELKALNSDLETFSYSVSHDLRGPLTRLSCSADALRSGYADHLDESGRFFLDDLGHAADQMRETIEAMLDLSRVNRNDPACRPLDLAEVARTVERDLRRSAPWRDVQVVIPDKLMVEGDERMFRIALENLLGNAWKFTEKHSPARIVLGTVLKEEGLVYFVSDNGDGFDMKESGRLFIPFNRLHRDTEYPGTGIGLATVQRVVQRHGGRIWAESSPGKGATFYFTLPPRDSQPPLSD